MREVLVDGCRIVFTYFFQSTVGAFEARDGLKEFFDWDPDLFKYFLGGAYILEIVASEYFYGITILSIGEIELPVVIGCMGMALIRYSLNVGSFFFAEIRRIVSSVNPFGMVSVSISVTKPYLYSLFVNNSAAVDIL